MPSTPSRRNASLDAMLLVGEQMSNLCFNIGQESIRDRPVSADDKATMLALARAWDKSKANLHDAPPKRRRKLTEK